MSSIMYSIDEEVKVSIHCMTYNHEKYIGQALESFVNQVTNFKFEIIVHDDASTDNTAKIVDCYAKKYPTLIKPIYQDKNIYNDPNHNAIYDYMLPMTSGKYIAICEGDDYWIDNNKLQIQYDFMEENKNCSLVVNDSKILYEKDGKLKSFFNNNFEDGITKIRKEYLMDNPSCFSTCSMFTKKEIFCKYKEFFMKVPMYDFMLKSVCAIEGDVYFIPTVMSVYRKGADGSWSNRIASDNEKYKIHMEYSIEYLKDLMDYTNHKYDKYLERAIKRREIIILTLLRDKKFIFSKQYRALFFQLSMKEKLIIIFKVYFYWVAYILHGKNK